MFFGRGCVPKLEGRMVFSKVIVLLMVSRNIPDSKLEGHDKPPSSPFDKGGGRGSKPWPREDEAFKFPL